MGNYKFRLSDMVPNAWFYKLNKTKTPTTTTNNHHKKPPSSSYYSPSTTTPPPENRHFYQSRNSFYHTPKVSHLNNSHKFPHFHDPSTKSSKRSKSNKKTIFKPSKLTEPTNILQDFIHSPMTTQSPYPESTQSQLSSSISHITIVKETKKIKFLPELNLQLPPIITKPAKPASRNRQESISGKKVKENSNQIPARKSVSGVKLRSNSPKLAVVKKIVQKSAQKKNLCESFAIVKSSFDPEQDFMQSMMEMITENNIRSSKELEELLACYLSLNSDEYHDVIVRAFEQIWFSLPDL